MAVSTGSVLAAPDVPTLATASRPSLRRAAVVAVALCAAVGLLSVALGPDNYWDLRYYHLYIPWAYLHDRYLYDVAPAEYQSFFNPLADFLFYGLISSPLNAMPRVIAFIMGAVHGVNVVLVAAISWHVLRPHDQSTRAALCAAAALIGVTGAGFVPLVGTTSNDLVNSIFILGGFLGVLRLAVARGDRALWRGFAWSGLSTGVGIGLKYTVAIYAPGLAVVALLVAVRRRRFVGLPTFGICAALGFLGLAGHHLLTLWRDFGNPIFPMMNDVFQSPYFEPVSGADGMFRAQGIWQLLTFPFDWARTGSYVVSELPLRDWRAAIACLALVVALGTRAAAVLTGGPTRDADRETCGLGLLLVFVGVSYVVWALVFGNCRYGVTLEMLTGVIIVGAVIQVARRPALRIVAAGALLAVAAATTVYPDWGRGRFGERYVDVRVPPMPARSLVLIATGDPVAFFIPFAEPTAQYIGIENDFLDLSQDNLLVAKARELMRTPGRAKFIVNVGTFDRARLDRILAQFGLTLGAAPCRPIRSNLENPAMSICPAVLRPRV